MANQIVKTGTNAVKEMLQGAAMQQMFKQAMGKHADAYISSIVELVSTDNQLKQCDPAQVCAQALKAATLQLPLQKALGNAYVVVYNNSVKTTDPKTGRESWQKVPTPTMIIGYRGLIQLAMRTGQYKHLNADIVYEGEYQGRNKLTGEIDLSGEKTSDKVVGYFCYFELLNGFSKMLYMSVDDVAKHAIKYSKSLGRMSAEELAKKAGTIGKSVGWAGDFDAMALKTCTRRLLSKYGYLSVEMQHAVAQDINADIERDVVEVDAVEIREAAVDEAATEEIIVDEETGEIKTEESAEQGFIPFAD